MTDEYIDSASTYEIVSIFRGEQPNDTYEWAWQSALAVTSSIITIPKLSMPPPPSKTGGASGPYGQLTGELNKLLRQEYVNNQSDKRQIDNVNKAKRAAKSWASRYPEKLSSTYENIKKDPSYQIWLDGYRTNSWTEHTVRLGGLFNYEFIPQISQILNIDEIKIKNIWEYSRNPKNLENLLKNGGEDLKNMEDAFMISSLIRGRYYDHIAKDSEIQMLQHPIRRYLVSKKMKDKQKSEFNITNVENYLSNIIIAGAYAEKTQKKRISSYTENIYKARTAVLNNELDLGPEDSEDAALDKAVEFAKEIKIRVHPKWVEKAIDVGHLMSVTSVGLLLSPWAVATLGIADSLISKKMNIPEMIPQIYCGRKKRLRELAISMPGRIEIVKKNDDIS